MKILIAGGGTGGHLFPGIALAQALETENPKNQVLFVGTYKVIAREILRERGYDVKEIESSTVRGKGLIQTTSAVLKVIRGLVQSISILKDFSPHLVVGVGGYSSAPIVMAARILGIKTVLHEQNALPGLTNRILSKFVDRVFISFPECRPYFLKKRTVVTGNPIRQELLKNVVSRGSKEKFTLLVIGGSQGAHRINAQFLSCLPYLEDLKDHLKIIHQTGEKDLNYVKQGYHDTSFERYVSSFIHDMAWAYNQSDLVIGRAGATTIAELIALGKPSILIPYPYAANNHQQVNARLLVKRGAAHMISDQDLSGKQLAETIRIFYFHPQTLKIMGNRAASMGKRDASQVMLKECLKLVPVEMKN